MYHNMIYVDVRKCNVRTTLYPLSSSYSGTPVIVQLSSRFDFSLFLARLTTN